MLNITDDETHVNLDDTVPPGTYILYHYWSVPATPYLIQVVQDTEVAAIVDRVGLDFEPDQGETLSLVSESIYVIL